ncbi:MAG TPA: hypothetical protein VIH59_15010 [Candidatus Tectomicrobia bacterium]
MAITVERPNVQACSVHQVARRRRVWSRQVYRKAMTLRDAIRVEEAECPHCLLVAHEAFKKQFPALFACPSQSTAWELSMELPLFFTIVKLVQEGHHNGLQEEKRRSLLRV